jgi:hypothetical protein
MTELGLITTSFEMPKPEADIKTTPTRVVVDSENVVKELKENDNEWSFFPQTETARDEARRDDARAHLPSCS